MDNGRILLLNRERETPEVFPYYPFPGIFQMVYQVVAMVRDRATGIPAGRRLAWEKRYFPADQ